MDLSVHAVPKPQHNRRVPKRGNNSKFSSKTIKEIFERDNYQCVRCGSFNLDEIPHHITYRSQMGKGTKRNGATICIRCHKQVHESKESKVVRKFFEDWRDRTLDDNGDKKELL